MLPIMLDFFFLCLLSCVHTVVPRKKNKVLKFGRIWNSNSLLNKTSLVLVGKCVSFIFSHYISYRPCFILHKHLIYINLFCKCLMCPPHVLVPCEADMEIKATVHKNISHCTIFFSRGFYIPLKTWSHNKDFLTRHAGCPVKEHTNQEIRWQQRWNKQVTAHVVCVDVPRHVTVRHELSVHVASDLAVPPATVDVNYADHVPLRKRKES